MTTEQPVSTELLEELLNYQYDYSHDEEIDFLTFRYCDNSDIKGNKDLALLVISTDDSTEEFQRVSSDLRDDFDVVKLAISVSRGLAIKYASDRLKRNKDLVKLAFYTWGWIDTEWGIPSDVLDDRDYHELESDDDYWFNENKSTYDNTDLLKRINDIYLNRV